VGSVSDDETFVGKLEGLGGQIPAQAWHALLANGSPRSYASGDVLVRQGEPGRYVMAERSGSSGQAASSSVGYALIMAGRTPADGHLGLMTEYRRYVEGLPAAEGELSWPAIAR
jgi:hypothetical protein